MYLYSICIDVGKHLPVFVDAYLKTHFCTHFKNVVFFGGKGKKMIKFDSIMLYHVVFIDSGVHPCNLSATLWWYKLKGSANPLKRVATQISKIDNTYENHMHMQAKVLKLTLSRYF